MGGISSERKSREVRLGIVMYGGVSLAIYINGVAREFFEAVRGRGVYRLLKALTDSDIVTDVISGTSAGGINGVMLSYALCNNREFAEAASLWRKHGDLALLLRPARDASATSLLDSEGYYQPKLEEVFRNMSRCARDPREDISQVPELDLFVTSTDVGGRIYTQFDDAGHPIDVKDHRAVFCLSHRAGRREPFAANTDDMGDPTIKALAKLSRATSCFPAAFAPVRVKLASDDGADQLLQKWGNLGKDCWFLDGGVLDNKPFTYTIKAIASRNADREVDRKLFYIEPDPECMKAENDAAGPTIVQSVLASLIGIPGYESIAEDLKALAARNGKLRQYERLLLSKIAPAASATSPAAKLLYGRCRLVSLSERVLRGIFRDNGLDRRIEEEGDRQRAARLIEQFDSQNLGPEIFDSFDIYYRHRRTSRIIYLIHDLLYTENGKGLSEAKRESFHKLWEALNCFIDAYDIIQAAMERLVDEAPIPWKTMPEDKVWMSVRGALERLLLVDGPPAQAILDQAAFEDALEANRCWITEQVLAAFNASLRDTIEVVVKEFSDSKFQWPDSTKVGLLKQLDDLERRTIQHLTDPTDLVWQATENFADTDALLFPIEMIGDLREKDIIETIRVSPRDAKRGFSAQGFTDKVAGDAMYHFGGFFKRSWRSNDILWGRLDGACQLIETLMDGKRLAKLTGDKASRAKLQDVFYETAKPGQPSALRTALDPVTLFPKAGAATHERLRAWLDELILGNAATALQADQFEEIISLLVEAAQLEILDKDFPIVLADAIGEQAEWNSFKIRTEVPAEQEVKDKSKTENPFFFRATKGTFDPLFALVAAEQRTAMAMKAFADDPATPIPRPSQTRLGQFFKTQYKVGAEELTRDIPAPILLELLGHSLLVTRNCVLHLFDESLRERVTSHPLYLFGLDYPLRAFYSAIILSRRAPAWAMIAGAALVGAAVLALAIGAVWFNPLIKSPEPTVIYLQAQAAMPPPAEHHWQWTPFLFLIVLPAVVLGASVWLLASGWLSRVFRK